MLRHTVNGKTAYIGLHAPVPVEIIEARMLVEESAIPATHMPVTDHPPFSNSDSSKILQTVHESSFINPIG